MQVDPRHRNQLFDATSIASYTRDYAAALQHALLTVDSKQIEAAQAALMDLSQAGKRVYVVGNGGSAAIADHLCCDWTKGTHCAGHSAIRTQSFSSNVALYSAIANDYGFENVFSTQVEFFGEAGDILVAISSSGNSQNILSAAKAARERGMTVIGLSGFSGGKLVEASDIALHVNIDNYGIVEDAHQALMHIIAQFTAIARDRG